LPPSPWCLGVDLAGLPTNPSGIAVLDRRRLMHLQSVETDEAIREIARSLGRRTVIAINAPLTLPSGRCCLDDDCRCRHDPGTRSREVERALARERVPTLATALIKVLARRGIALAESLRRDGFEVLETYPFATLRLLDLPATGKRSRAGRQRIGEAVSWFVPGLAGLDPSEHELDAVVCALTADLWLRGQCRLVGDPAEGQMVVPVARTSRYSTILTDSARAAESEVPYSVTPGP
jgi:predicted nuclease with RNAse H fold